MYYEGFVDYFTFSVVKLAENAMDMLKRLLSWVYINHLSFRRGTDVINDAAHAFPVPCTLRKTYTLMGDASVICIHSRVTFTHGESCTLHEGPFTPKIPRSRLQNPKGVLFFCVSNSGKGVINENRRAGRVHVILWVEESPTCFD